MNLSKQALKKLVEMAVGTTEKSEPNKGELASVIDLLLGALSDDGEDESFFTVGENYIIRTVTYHYTGRCKTVGPREIVLEGATWVADSGRWAEALAKGSLQEQEPFPNEVMITRDVIVDAAVWEHDLPRETK